MMQGFFDLGVSLAPVPVKSRTAAIGGCDACGLGCSGQIPTTGKGKKRILLILEHPSKDDFEAEEYFNSESGEYLSMQLQACGIMPLRDCWTTAAVLCPSDSEVTTKHGENCRKFLLEEIERLQPHIVIPLGMLAIQTLLGHRMSGRIRGNKPTDFIGEQIPDQDLGVWVCPTYPAKFAMAPRAADIALLFNKHLKAAISLLDVEIPVIDESGLEWTQDVERATQWVNEAREYPEVTFDYETTGIKPQRFGHRIVSASLAYDTPDHIVAKSFPFFDDEEFQTAWKRLMRSKNSKKIAHNASFEINWTVNCCGYYPVGWEWDTCLGAHSEHNQKPTGLKWHTFAKLGIIGFDDDVDTYLTSAKNASEKEKGNNGFNRIEECPMSVLLPYGAKDSLYTHALYKIQKAALTKIPHLLDGLGLFLLGQEELTRAHIAGMNVDMEALEQTKSDLNKRIADAHTKIATGPEAQAYRSQTGKILNVQSDVQLSELLYKILKLKGPKGMTSTDEEALNDLNTPFTQEVLALRKLSKICGYIENYERETVDGVLHPFFGLNKVKTYRSSSDSPNFQNIPKRDKAAQTLIRSLFKPSAGNRIVEYDYKAVEVCISACYHKDPNMIKYIKDPSSDMHRDTAFDLFFRTQEDFLKEERQGAKNGFVFPAFYGSVAQQMGPGIWEAASKLTRDHLYKNGIKNVHQFTEHVAAIEKVFWGTRFRAYGRWRQEMHRQTVKDGYYDTHTGFRIQLPVKFTEITNAPIQGSAFHVLLYTLIMAGPQVRAISGRSHFIGQIHDALVGDIHPEDEAEADTIIKQVGTVDIREHFPWIIVPLTLEKERSEIDGTWAKMEGCGNL